MFILRRARNGRRKSRGQSLVEFSLVLPLFLLIVMFGIDFGRAYLGWVNLQNVTRVGANYASTHPSSNPADTLLYFNPAKYNALITDDFSTSNCVLGAIALPTYIDG